MFEFLGVPMLFDLLRIGNKKYLAEIIRSQSFCCNA